MRSTKTFFKHGSHAIILIIPPVLATVLYSTYIVSSNFRDSENFSTVFLLQSVLFFYVYLFSMVKADAFAEASTLLTGPVARRVTAFFIAFGFSQMFTLAAYAALKQYHISVLGQNDVLSAYHLTSRALNTVFGFLLMYSIYVAFKVYNASLEGRLRLEQTRNAQTSLRYDQLSSKLDPHFLFNSLNTLHTLLPDHADEAEQFIASLSKTLRYSLEAGKEDLVSLEHELGMLQEYTQLMKSRFCDSLIMHVDLPVHSGWMVFPMTLIHLMENAIKHNEVSAARPLTMSVGCQNDHLCFRNNRNPKIQAPSLGGSLATLSELYEIKTGSGIQITENEHAFTVSVPIIKQDRI